MGHLGRYGDRFWKITIFTSTMGAYGPIETLLAVVMGWEYFSSPLFLLLAPFLGQVLEILENCRDDLVLELFFKVSHFCYSRLYLN